MGKIISRRLWLFIPLALVAGAFGLFFFKTSFTISQIIENSPAHQTSNEDLALLPKKDPDRINILLLGMRDANEPGEGKLLTDTIMIASVKESTGQTALISIPRDLYVKIWCAPEKEKINFAYPYGGLDCAKKTVAMTTGLYIDYAVNANFEALEEVIDALGGVDVYLEQPFEESFQWAREGWEESAYWFIKDFDEEQRWVFHLPAGASHLDGQTALYFARSRYSTNDFDRMRRQQQIIMAIKNKALSLGVLTNPVKVYHLLDVLGKNIRTDMPLSEIKNLIARADKLNQNATRVFFDTTSEGLLYDTMTEQGEYILLPTGDNFDRIQQACQNIFTS